MYTLWSWKRVFYYIFCVNALVLPKNQIKKYFLLWLRYPSFLSSLVKVEKLPQKDFLLWPKCLHFCIQTRKLSWKHCSISSKKAFLALCLLKRNIVRCYSNLKPNIPTRNCIGSLRSQDLCKWYHTNCRLVMRSGKSY